MLSGLQLRSARPTHCVQTFHMPALPWREWIVCLIHDAMCTMSGSRLRAAIKGPLPWWIEEAVSGTSSEHYVALGAHLHRSCLRLRLLPACVNVRLCFSAVLLSSIVDFTLHLALSLTPFSHTASVFTPVCMSSSSMSLCSVCYYPRYNAVSDELQGMGANNCVGCTSLLLLVSVYVYVQTTEAAVASRDA